MIRMAALLVDKVDLSFVVREGLTRLGAVTVIMHSTIQDDITADCNLLRLRRNRCLRRHSTYRCGLYLSRIGCLRDNGYAVRLISFEADTVVGIFVVSCLMIVFKRVD